MNTYTAKIRVGAKTFNATAEAASQTEAYDKVHSAAVARFPDEAVMVLKVECLPTEMVGVPDFFKGLFR